MLLPKKKKKTIFSMKEDRPGGDLNVGGGETTQIRRVKAEKKRVRRKGSEKRKTQKTNHALNVHQKKPEKKWGRRGKNIYLTKQLRKGRGDLQKRR